MAESTIKKPWQIRHTSVNITPTANQYVSPFTYYGMGEIDLEDGDIVTRIDAQQQGGTPIVSCLNYTNGKYYVCVSSGNSNVVAVTVTVMY